MRKFISGLLALGLVLSACQQEQLTEVDPDAGDAVVTISLTSPDAALATRSLNSGANSAKGGLTNVSLSEYNLRYQLAVYRVSDSDLTQVVAPTVITKSDTDAASFSLSLSPGYTYKFVAWADFVTAGSTEDLHYNTADLTNIYVLDSETAQLNDESRDAYFVSYETTVSSSTTLSLALSRPFAKLRVVTTDYANGVSVPDAVSLSYYGCTRFSSLNAVTGEVSGETLSDSGNTTYTGTLASDKEYSAGVDAEDAYRTLLVDYLLAEESEQTAIHFTFSSSANGSEILSTDVSTNVPIQRNYLTSVSGALLTSDNANVDVDIDISDSFGGDDDEDDDEDDSGEFDGYTVDADTNLWKSATLSYSFYYAPGWSQITDPTYTTDGNCYYSVALSTATDSQWQAQCWLTSDITTSSSNSYDFSCKFTSTTDLSNVTVKLYDTSNNDVYLSSEEISLSAGEQSLYYLSEMTGVDLSALSLLLDFGGNAENTTVEVADIVFQIHGADGVYAPDEEEEEDSTVYTYDSSTNLWKPVDDSQNDSTFVYYAPNWVETTGLTCNHSGSTWEFTIPSATYQIWQAQYHIIPETAIAVEADTQYDFCCTITSTTSFTGVTVKLTQVGDDGNYLMAETIAVTADTPYTYTLPAATFTTGAADAVKLVFDFGCNPDNTVVTVTDIVLQKTGATADDDEEEEASDPLYAEWLFSADTYSAGTHSAFATAAGEDATKAEGTAGAYVYSNVSGTGYIYYYSVDKTELDTSNNFYRTIGTSGHPYVVGAWPGDYWLFTAEDGTEYPAGTQLHISFITRISGTGLMYWLLEYWDGAEWQSAGDTSTVTIDDTEYTYNFTPTTSTSNSSVDYTWTLASACTVQQFRYKAVAPYTAKDATLTAPNGGTCRIAGASGTSPVFEVVSE